MKFDEIFVMQARIKDYYLNFIEIVFSYCCDFLIFGSIMLAKSHTFLRQNAYLLTFGALVLYRGAGSFRIGFHK